MISKSAHPMNYNLEQSNVKIVSLLCKLLPLDFWNFLSKGL